MNLHYTDNGDGFPVVFVHAFPLDGRMWDETVSAVVSEGYRALVPDLPGFGQSEDHPNISSMDSYASDIAEMLEEEGIGRAVFCGLSMGGYVLFALFRARPEIFAGLILCDTTAEADTDEKREGRAKMIERVESEGTGVLADDLLPNLISASTLENDRPLVTRLSEMIVEQPPSAVCAALRGMAQRPDSKDLLAGMDFPVKLIFGTDDTVTGAEAAKTLQDRLPSADLAFVASAGHYSNMEKPAVFNGELISYLNSLTLNH